MNLLKEISADFQDSCTEKIVIGSHWVAVVTEQYGRRGCGLASNPVQDFQMDALLKAKLVELEKQSTRELCELMNSSIPPLTSIGLAAINALLPHQN